MLENNNEVEEEIGNNTILVGASKNENISYSMKELENLAEAAGLEVLGQMVQNISKINAATYIGKGKVLELRDLCENMEVGTVVFNDELSGIQIRNLEEVTGTRVIDRTILILDIFASRAISKEGKLQVELAQLQYRIPRLLGFGKSLSRLGGGIGTRGPGEKKLETDRRHISKRMDDIKKELKESQKTRAVQRKKREKSQIPLVALVGYTNSGKSATMNRLLSIFEDGEKTVESKDLLFATLDTQQRKIRLEKNKEFILVDTVGFVSKLPHFLVEAFKATLEEVKYADLILHLVDASYEEQDFQIEVTDKVLDEMGISNKEKIIIYNKIDMLDENHNIINTDRSIGISAKNGEGFEQLIEKIEDKIFEKPTLVELKIPYSKGTITSFVCEKGKVETIEHLEDGTKIKVLLKKKDYEKVNQYVTL